MALDLTLFISKDDPQKETGKRLKEPFKFHEFKYIDSTLTQEEKYILCERLPDKSVRGTKYQMFKDGKIIDTTEEYIQFMNNEPASKPLQAWFKYQALLKDEEEARRLENQKRASEIKRPPPYGGQ
jgi:hypothetical protein